LNEHASWHSTCWPRHPLVIPGHSRESEKEGEEGFPDVGTLILQGVEERFHSSGDRQE